MINEYSRQTAESLLQLQRSTSQGIRVAIPGIVTEYRREYQTVSVQPSIMETINGNNQMLPLLTDIPVFFPGGSMISVTYDINPGDECLVIFSDTSIDSWYQSGGIQLASSPRRHSISDGFALVGFRSKPNSVKDISDSNLLTVKCKTEDGWKNSVSIDKHGNVTSAGSSKISVSYDDRRNIVITSD